MELQANSGQEFCTSDVPTIAEVNARARCTRGFAGISIRGVWTDLLADSGPPQFQARRSGGGLWTSSIRRPYTYQAYFIFETCTCGF